MGAEGASLASRIQRRLSRCYGIHEAPEVDAYVKVTDDHQREHLVVQEDGDGLGIALHLPRRALEVGPVSLDQLCQIVEGVSHFLYIADRARRELPTTELEMELQAEVDKYVVLVDPCHEASRPGWATRVRHRLYERVSFLHPAGTERGDRYRTANRLAAVYAHRLEDTFGRRGLLAEMRDELRRFFWAGQSEKLELTRAA